MRLAIKISSFLLLLSTVSFLSSCDRFRDIDKTFEEIPDTVVSDSVVDDTVDDTPIKDNGQQQGDNDTVYTPNKYASRLEVPALDPDNLFVYHCTYENGDSVMSYCYEYNKEKYHSNWVAFRFDSVTRTISTSREDNFQDDPKLPFYLQIDKMSYSGYDRGHICASADRLYSPEANMQTFYMSNMSPQLSQFNQKYWVKFEDYVQGIGRDSKFCDTLYVVKGGTIADDMILGRVTRPNGVQVVVPAYYFIALLKVVDGHYSSIAFFVEHKTYDHAATDADLKNAIMSVDELESHTGIDFFHNLPDSIEVDVESSYTLSSLNIK